MKLMNEDQVLNIGYRAAVIDEIKSAENVGRKREHKKRYDVYKDKTVKWVIKSLEGEGLKLETIQAMTSRASNISICRKIVNKLARTYASGVSRETGSPDGDKAVSEMERFLKFDDKMRKSDRYRELQKNCVLQFVQERSGGTAEIPLYRIGMKVLGPWQYDVIEDCYDREIARCFILSDFIEQYAQTGRTEAQAGYHDDAGQMLMTNRKDDLIADDPDDSGQGKKRTFIWWTDNYHFTTYEDGSICAEMTPIDNLNPIETLPFVNNAEEQDGQFWAQGGDDLVDGSILVNKIMTDMFFIAYQQGYGIPVITGRNLKERYSIGPNNALIFDYDPTQEDPKPEVTFASAQPPLGDWMKLVEQYVALLLTTNNLSPTNIAGQLSAATFPSGIAMLVESSEATNDIEDKQRVYVGQERHAWHIIQAWQSYLLSTDEADEDFRNLPALPDDLGANIAVKFNEPRQIVTEKEKLDNLKLRQDLGLNEEVDLILLDNPDMTRDEAEQKLLKIKEQKLSAVAAFGAQQTTNQQQTGTGG